MSIGRYSFFGFFEVGGGGGGGAPYGGTIRTGDDTVCAGCADAAALEPDDFGAADGWGSGVGVGVGATP